MTEPKILSKMGHSASPKGLSSVGTPNSSQPGCDMFVDVDVTAVGWRMCASGGTDEGKGVTFCQMHRWGCCRR